MTQQEAKAIVAMLRAVYPNSRNAVRDDTAVVYVSLLRDLDYDVASAAVRRLIGEKPFFPAFAEIKKAYQEERGARRRARERDPQPEALVEPTTKEKQRQLAEMQQWIASTWPGAGDVDAGARLRSGGNPK